MVRKSKFELSKFLTKQTFYANLFQYNFMQRFYSKLSYYILATLCVFCIAHLGILG